MSLAMPAALMLMALSAAPTEASGVLTPCAEGGERHVEWQEDTPGRVHEVCVSPGWFTTFSFDARVERLELEGPERFQVLTGEEGFSLRLKEKLPEGTRLALTVHLQGEAVWSLSFILRVHAGKGERQVMVSRAPRTLASYREGEKQARAELRQCQQQKERLQAECEGPGGLVGLLVKKLMGYKGVRGQKLEHSPQGDALSLKEGSSYRSSARVAVALWWKNPGTVARKVTRVVLVGPQGEEMRPLNVWLPEPLPPGGKKIVAVEWEATAVQASGEYTLQLWGEGGEGEAEWRMEVRGVRFPSQEE